MQIRNTGSRTHGEASLCGSCIAEMLDRNTRLRKLDLSWNSIGFMQSLVCCAVLWCGARVGNFVLVVCRPAVLWPDQLRAADDAVPETPELGVQRREGRGYRAARVITGGEHQVTR